MNIALVTTNTHPTKDARSVRALRIATLIAPLLSGFALGVGLGVLLWQLF